MSKDEQIKRYAPYRMLTREEGPHMFETMHGDWVRASDYDALKQENERANAKIAKYQTLVREMTKRTSLPSALNKRGAYIESRIAEIEST